MQKPLYKMYDRVMFLNLRGNKINGVIVTIRVKVLKDGTYSSIQYDIHADNNAVYADIPERCIICKCEGDETSMAMNDYGLLNLDRYFLQVWKLNDQMMAVAYENCEVKDGSVLISEFGKGRTFEEACKDYRRIISGKTLVFNATEASRKEVIVL